jgi:C-terminal processing protease CtpA/Prc
MKKFNGLFSLLFSCFILIVFISLTTVKASELSFFNLSKTNQVSSLKRKKSQPQGVENSSYIVNTHPNEGNTNHINYFKLAISSPLAVDASVFYETRKGSAEAGKDYVAKSGVATIEAGKLSIFIGVEIIADKIAESDEDFYLVISRPIGASFANKSIEIKVKHTIVDDDALGYAIIKNYSKSVESIKAIYLRKEGESDWGKNILPEHLSPNWQRKFNIKNCNQIYDIKSVYINNKDVIKKQINVKCEQEIDIWFWLYQSTIPEENIDCSTQGQNKMLYDIMKDTYLWYQHTPDLAYESYTNLDSLLDALKYKQYDQWSFITTINEYNQYYEEGTYLGFGYSFIRENGKIYTRFVYKNSPADKAGLERGVEILSINGKTIQEIDDENLWSSILGENKEGVEATFIIRKNASISTAVMKKSIFTANSVMESKVLNVNGKKIGYILFNTFINPSIEELNTVFTDFKKNNVSELILDLRYNGGGQLKVSRYLASLISGKNTEGQLFTTLAYNDKFTHWNNEYKFSNESNSFGLNSVYIITTKGTASASEYLINGLTPFLNVHLIGSKTHGKPVGMNGYRFCGKHIAPIMFKGVNANNEGDYFEGIETTCDANDDVTHPFGSLEEGMLKETLYFMKNNRCSVRPSQRKLVRRKAPKEKEIYTGFSREIGAF